MWPCGVIVFASELFISESLSQVYAVLHEFIRRNETNTAALSTSVKTLYITKLQARKSTGGIRCPPTNVYVIGSAVHACIAFDMPLQMHNINYVVFVSRIPHL